MNSETEITRFVAVEDVVTYKTLEKAAEEANDYEWMRAGDHAHVCKHGDKIYPLLLREIDGEHMIACGCKAWQFAHDNDGCKHVAVFLKRSKPPQKPITDEIAKDLMAAGWTGSKGHLIPPTAALPNVVAELPPVNEAPAQTATSDPDGGDNEGDDPVPDRAPKPTPEPKPTIEETKQEEEPTMIEKEETKTYTHPDGTEFESAVALLDYADSAKAEQNAEVSHQAATFELAPMIKGIRPQMRERGRITIGKKGDVNASGRGRKTIKFDHFVFTTTEKDEKTDDYILDTKMNERYGDQCREIPVRFLSDDITEIFHTSYAKYTASGIKLRGDGENWIVYNTDGTRDYISDPDGKRGFLDDPDVKPHGILTVLVDGQDSVGSVYRWRTTSWNSINGMLSSLALCAKIAERAGGRIAFLPMKLMYSFKWVTPQGQATKKKIPVITCEFRGSIEELQERSRDAMQYLTAGNGDRAQLAEANVYDAEAETIEEQKDVAAEFAPGVI